MGKLTEAHEREALLRIQDRTERYGGATFPLFMLENMRLWQRRGWIKIENTYGEQTAVITDAGRAALKTGGE